MDRLEKVITHLEYLLDKDNIEIGRLLDNWHETSGSEVNLCEILLYQLMLQNEDGYRLKLFSFYEK